MVNREGTKTKSHDDDGSADDASSNGEKMQGVVVKTQLIAAEENFFRSRCTIRPKRNADPTLELLPIKDATQYIEEKISAGSPDSLLDETSDPEPFWVTFFGAPLTGENCSPCY